eukprot:14288704-Alexandrium_andersonii.AAC.1
MPDDACVVRGHSWQTPLENTCQMCPVCLCCSHADCCNALAVGLRRLEKPNAVGAEGSVLEVLPACMSETMCAPQRRLNKFAS